MENVKVTKKDNFIAIVDVLEAADRSDLADVIKHEIELLEAKAAKAKAAAEKKKTEGDALYDAVAAALTDELHTIADITASLNDETASVSKVQYRLNKLVANGIASKEQVFVGEGETRRKLMAYKLV